MKKLKEAIVSEFGTFAFVDRRCRNVDDFDIFYVDGRTKMDFASDKKPFGTFCKMQLTTVTPTHVQLSLSGNVPVNDKINKWISDHDLDRSDQYGRNIVLTITPSTVGVLNELATMIASITQPGAPRYTVPSYKHTCPQASIALQRLSRVLKKEWNV